VYKSERGIRRARTQGPIARIFQKYVLAQSSRR